jgi:hypothetical protein
MSKAFTREDDTADDAPVVPRPTLGAVVRLTHDAVTRLRAEAASTDDTARRRLLTEALERATLVPEGAPDRVVLGARVTVESDAEGRREHRLVSRVERRLAGRSRAARSGARRRGGGRPTARAHHAARHRRRGVTTSSDGRYLRLGPGVYTHRVLERSNRQGRKGRKGEGDFEGWQIEPTRRPFVPIPPS